MCTLCARHQVQCQTHIPHDDKDGDPVCTQAQLLFISQAHIQGPERGSFIPLVHSQVIHPNLSRACRVIRS